MKKSKHTSLHSIIVVDDDAGILDALRIVLTAEGYAVTTMNSGETLLSIDKEHLPDLILLDMLLSGIDGRDICRELKKRTLTKHIPIIMFSAHPNAGRDVKRVGADGFVAKPFSIKDLLSTI